MKTTERTTRSTLAKTRMVWEGMFATPQGNLVQTICVDLAGKLPPGTLCLAKASEPRFDIRTADSVRLSRPAVFRNTGEVLVKDEQEGRAETSRRKTIEGTTEVPAEMDRRVRALNAGLRLSHTKLSANATMKSETTHTDRSAFTFGQDCLIYCSSLWPEADQADAWRRTFPDTYTSVAPIHRPMQFAQALGLGVCEHIGATGKAAPIKGTFHGFMTSEMDRTPQIVLHGPVLYVDDPYRCIAEAEEGWEQICSMIFVKSYEYAPQNEYRFAMMSIRSEVGEVFDLPVSGMMRDCLLPVKCPVDAANIPLTMAPDDRESGEQRETHRGYTYQRRKVRRETGNWGDGEPGSSPSNEEIVEETVTSPDEIPEPFPEEAKQPDVIVIERVAGQMRFFHRVYREEATESWHIETLRKSPTIIEDPGANGLPQALAVPPEDRFETLHEPPTDPRFVLELCLNPSIPRPPWRHERLARCGRGEMEHMVACWRSLGAAVDLVVAEERERAAASAWYAADFVVDLVCRFGPIVKRVCVIPECVAVVEFERAPFTGAVGWATLSASGTYTLYLHRGSVEEVVFSGRLSPAGRLRPSTYVEALQKNGWHLRRHGPRARTAR